MFQCSCHICRFQQFLCSIVQEDYYWHKAQGQSRGDSQLSQLSLSLRKALYMCTLNGIPQCFCLFSLGSQILLYIYKRVFGRECFLPLFEKQTYRFLTEAGRAMFCLYLLCRDSRSLLMSLGDVGASCTFHNDLRLFLNMRESSRKQSLVHMC